MQYRIKFGAATAVVLLAGAQIGAAAPLNTNDNEAVTTTMTPLDRIDNIPTEVIYQPTQIQPRFETEWGTTTTQTALGYSRVKVFNIKSFHIVVGRDEAQATTTVTPLDRIDMIPTEMIINPRAEVTTTVAPLDRIDMIPEDAIINPRQAVDCFRVAGGCQFHYTPKTEWKRAEATTTVTPLDRIDMIPTERIINPRAEATTTVTPLDRIDMIPEDAIINPRHIPCYRQAGCRQHGQTAKLGFKSVVGPILPRDVTTTVTPLDRIDMIPTEAIINARAEETTTVTPLDRIDMIPTEAIINARAEETTTVTPLDRVTMIPENAIIDHIDTRAVDETERAGPFSVDELDLNDEGLTRTTIKSIGNVNGTEVNGTGLFQTEKKFIITPVELVAGGIACFFNKKCHESAMHTISEKRDSTTPVVDEVKVQVNETEINGTRNELSQTEAKFVITPLEAIAGGIACFFNKKCHESATHTITGRKLVEEIMVNGTQPEGVQVEEKKAVNPWEFLGVGGCLFTKKC